LDEEKWHGHWGTLMPFYRACGQPGNVLRPRPAPQCLRQPAVWPRCDGSLARALRHELAPKTPHGKPDDWAKRLLQHWRPGEAAALDTMQSWLRSGLHAYEASRNRADTRCILDLAGRRREMVNAVLTMRRANQTNNDNGGYDLVTIPAGPQRGLRTRLFTKQEYRISRTGNQLPQSQHKRQRKGNQTAGTQAPIKSQRRKHERVGRTMDDWLRSQGLER